MNYWGIQSDTLLHFWNEDLLETFVVRSGYQLEERFMKMRCVVCRVVRLVMKAMYESLYKTSSCHLSSIWCFSSKVYVVSVSASYITTGATTSTTWTRPYCIDHESQTWYRDSSGTRMWKNRYKIAFVLLCSSTNRQIQADKNEPLFRLRKSPNLKLFWNNTFNLELSSLA